VSGRIHEVDQKLGTLGIRDIDNADAELILDVEVERDAGGLDGDGTGSLVGTGVREALLSGLLIGDNAGSADKRSVRVDLP